MKRRALIPVFMASCLLFSCKEISSPSEKIKVTFIESPFYSLKENSYEVGRGESLAVEVSFITSYSFLDCSYKDYSVETVSEQTYLLTLNNIYYPMRVTIDAANEDNFLLYDLNGGVFNDGANTNTSFVAYYPLEHHLRANTDRGKEFHRNGYLLSGWNTEKDGSGRHIGLGSKVTLNDDVQILYAEYQKETDINDFKFTTKNDEVYFSEYVGSKNTDSIVLPRSYNGKTITGIAAGFMEGVKANSLYIGSNIISIDSNAFKGNDFQLLNMSDSADKVHPDSMDDKSFTTLQLNAFKDPVFLGYNEISQFGSTIDRLILNKNKKKMVFYAGCSMSYGLDSTMVAAKFPDYTVIDLGYIGGSSATYAYDFFKDYLQEGDIFIHAPEVMSDFQFMANDRAEHRMFLTCESNYDILSSTDWRQYTDVFGAFNEYQGSRALLPGGTYDNYNAHFNEYGDNISVRKNYNGDNRLANEGEEYDYDMNLVEASVLDKLKEKYDMMTANGATLYFSYSPVNYDGISAEHRSTRIFNTFDNSIKEYFKETKYKVISKASEYCMKGRYFYDKDYHLTNDGAKYRTEILVYDIQQAMK